MSPEEILKNVTEKWAKELNVKDLWERVLTELKRR